jgi:hypothetical protein
MVGLKKIANNLKKTTPLKGTGKLSELFELIRRGHEEARRVSFPSSQISARYHTRLNKFLRVSYPSKEISAGYQTPGNNF